GSAFSTSRDWEGRAGSVTRGWESIAPHPKANTVQCLIFGARYEIISPFLVARGGAMIRKQDALEYHSRGRHGKIEVTPSKTLLTQRDLSLAYSPGVAEPCLEIARDPDLVFEYTARGNLVAVVSNGTAAPGPGDSGPLVAQ